MGNALPRPVERGLGIGQVVLMRKHLDARKAQSQMRSKELAQRRVRGPLQYQNIVLPFLDCIDYRNEPAAVGIDFADEVLQLLQFQLVAEKQRHQIGEEQNIPIPEIGNLRHCVDRLRHFDAVSLSPRSCSTV